MLKKRLPQRHAQLAEKLPNHGSGELCSPVGDRRSPLRISKILYVENKEITPADFQGLSGFVLFCSINWNLSNRLSF